jgi:hypothetical protein
MNNQIKTSAVVQQRVEKILKEMDRPITVQELWDRPFIREVCKHVGSIHDTITTLHKKKLIRRMPYNGPIKYAKRCYEWIKPEESIKSTTPDNPLINEAEYNLKVNTMVDNLLAENLQLINTINEWDSKAAVTKKPSVHVGKDSITIESGKFKITIEL